MREDLAAKEADKAANKARKAAHRSNQDLAAKEADKAANMAQNNAQRARKTTKLTKYDGLHSKEVLEGSFHVPALEDSADAIGPMDQNVSLLQGSQVQRRATKVVMHEWQDTDTLLPMSGSGICQPVLATQQGGRNLKARSSKKYIWSLNNSCCLSSLKANKRKFCYTPTVIFQGQAHQFAGPLQARDGETPIFAQLYVLDPSLEFTTRFANLSVPQNIRVQERGELGEILFEVQELLKRDNPYIKDYHQIIKIPDEDLATGMLVISASARPTGETRAPLQ